MAITNRVGPHNAWLIAGGSFQCIEGSAELYSTGAVGVIRTKHPLNAPGYMEAFAGMEGIDAEVMVETAFDTQKIAKGKISKIEFDLIGGVIHVRAEDAMAELNKIKTNTSFKNQMGGQIIQQMCQQAGIPCKADSGTVMAGKKTKDDYVKITSNQSIASVINRLSQFDNARYWVDKEGVLNYKIPGDQGGGGGSYEIFWKQPTASSPMVSDCLALIVIHNTYAAEAQGANSNSWQPYEKKLVQGQTGASMPSAGTPGVTAGALTYTFDNPNDDKQQAQQRADAAYKIAGSHEYEIHATFVGDPNIDPSMSITLSGGSPFDGTYPIDKVTHVFGMRGYTTSVNSKGKGGKGGGV